MIMKCKPIEERLPNITGTLKRQSTAGNVAFLVLAAYMIAPLAIDRYRGEPNIAATLTHHIGVDGSNEIIVETNVKYKNFGGRHNFTYDENNKILCSKQWETVWSKSSVWTWDTAAFTGCAEPKVPYKVCTTFAIEGISGIVRLFGSGQEFCTDFINPQELLNEYEL